MIKKNFKKKLAVLSSVLALNSLNVPKTQSWGVVRTFSKVGAVVFSNRLIGSIMASWFFPKNCKLVESKEESNGYDKMTKEEFDKRRIQQRIALMFALALEVALSDIVVERAKKREK